MNNTTASKLIKILEELLVENNLAEIKKTIHHLYSESINWNTDSDDNFLVPINGHTIAIKEEFLLGELRQIKETYSIDRSKYYIQRLIKAISEVKTNDINDLNMNRWKEYDDILTDSLWLVDKRDNSGAHSASYWGNFIPQIPNQFLRRYTKQGEWVLDTFLGSGTTLIECKRLGRNGIGIELQKDVAEKASTAIQNESTLDENVQTEIIQADCTSLNYTKELQKRGIPSVQFLMIHPPYWDIIKFSESKKDFSNAESMNDFLKKMRKLIDQTLPILDNGRYMALIISDKYSKGEWIPMGFYTMQEVLKTQKYKLKSIIVKNFEDTKGKMQQKELWRYRALQGGFYVFKHEYIYLFQKHE